MNKHYIIPIFVPHYGCPHDCVFCNQKKITGISTTVTARDVENIIKGHLLTFKNPGTIEVAFFGGSFTAIDIEVQKELLSVAVKYKKMDKIDKIRLSTRPDSIDSEILEMLKENLVDTIELGVQSLDDDVLRKSARGHSASDLYKAANLIKEYDINLGLQMMIGLPGDSIEKSIHTCKEFIKLKPFCVRIYPTLVIKETFLENEYLNNNYEPISLKEAIESCSTILMIFMANNIDVIRVGLQPTDRIQLGKDVVAGPFHPAFRQLVESNIYLKLIEAYLLKEKLATKNKNLLIEANNKIISSISGQKSSNRKHLMEKYKFNKIKILGKDIDSNEINIILARDSGTINVNDMMKSYLQKTFRI